MSKLLIAYTIYNIRGTNNIVNSLIIDKLNHPSVIKGVLDDSLKQRIIYDATNKYELYSHKEEYQVALLGITELEE